MVVGPYCRIVDTRKVVIGNDVVLSSGVSFVCTGRDMDPHRGGNDMKNASIIIVDGSWLGNNAIVLSDVRIGRGSSIAPGAVVRQVRIAPSILFLD